jgi:hypothetical protein
MPAKKMKAGAKPRPRKTVAPFSGPSCEPPKKPKAKKKK